LAKRSGATDNTDTLIRFENKNLRGRCLTGSITDFPFALICVHPLSDFYSLQTPTV
jgi:hypothetical protein